MLSRNQLKVGKSFAETMTEAKSVQKFWLRERRRGFSLEGKDNQQNTYDNETGEHTSRQRPIFIQDWQAHLENKE